MGGGDGGSVSTNVLGTYYIRFILYQSYSIPVLGEAHCIISMLSNQMNQQAMQQQMFQQSLKMQMEAIEKKGDLTNKYLCRITRNIGSGGKRRKRYKRGSSSSSSSSSNNYDDGDDKSSKQDK